MNGRAVVKVANTIACLNVIASIVFSVIMLIILGQFLRDDELGGVFLALLVLCACAGGVAWLIRAIGKFLGHLLDRVDFIYRRGSIDKEKIFPPSDMVRIPGKDLKMCRTQVTQKQWVEIMGSNPSSFTGMDNPVENVSWDDCQEFIERLNSLGGIQYRLPSEEEWEFACRAGSTGKWGKRENGEEGTLDAMGWYGENSEGTTHPVAQKEPNAWGLYDMHGNVWEWTSTSEVNRGGCWRSNVNYCEASYQGVDDPSYADDGMGFRLACSSGLGE